MRSRSTSYITTEQGQNSRRMILKALASYFNRYERPATVREICAFVGLSKPTVMYHLHWMVEEGLVTKLAHGTRCYQANGIWP